jgi:hypothetical protein
MWTVSETNFPIYLQNHPLNEGEFDDGEFIKLEEKLT